MIGKELNHLGPSPESGAMERRLAPVVGGIDFTATLQKNIEGFDRSSRDVLSQTPAAGVVIPGSQPRCRHDARVPGAVREARKRACLPQRANRGRGDSVVV